MAIPLSSRIEWSLANPLWAASLNPFIANPMNSVQILENINLIDGITVINHMLGHEMNGWFITDITSAATIYRSAPLNNLTLTLTSNVAVTVNLGVF